MYLTTTLGSCVPIFDRSGLAVERRVFGCRLRSLRAAVGWKEWLRMKKYDGQRNCKCELPSCPHPKFSAEDPTCTNWPESDGLCNECRKNRPVNEAMFQQQSQKMSD
jgi:hypothetical protein